MREKNLIIAILAMYPSIKIVEADVLGGFGKFMAVSAVMAIWLCIYLRDDWFCQSGSK